MVKWPSFVRNKAMQQARETVKKELRQQGGKTSIFTRQEIDKAAAHLLKEQPQIFMEASTGLIFELTKLRAEARKLQQIETEMTK